MEPAGLFPRREQFAVGPYPCAITRGDLNGDQVADLVTANCGSDDVSILLGRGGAAFETHATYAVGDYPCSAAIGDFDGDGAVDLATANCASGSVSVLLGRGDGTFETQTAHAVGRRPYAVASGDLDGDGAMDLVTANYGSANVSVLLGRGDGTFETQATYAVGSYTEYVALDDLDGDGVPDLATANGVSNTVSVLLGRGDGTFEPQTTYAVGSHAFSIALGDLDGDGAPDLVTGNACSNDVSVLLGRGDGTFEAQAAYPVGSYPYSVAIGDLDGDEAPDLVTANFLSGDISVLLGRGDGTFATQTTYVVGSGPISVVLGDLDGDEMPDLATANYGRSNVSVLIANESPTAEAGGPYVAAEGGMVTLDGSGSTDPNQPSASLVYAWDFDGDGQFDDAAGASPQFSAATLDGYVGSSVTVALRVSDVWGRWSDDAAIINIANVPPTLVGLTVTGVEEGSESSLSAAITDPGLTDTFSLTIDWGDGTATDIDPATSPVAANHTYADSGSYSATVTVMDDDGGQSAYPVTVIVQNVAPTAVFSNGGPYDEGSVGIVGFTAQFDPSPADSGQGFRYSYDFDNDGVFEIDRSSNASATIPAEYLAEGPGTRTVLGRIEDKDGGFTDYATLVAVNNVPPVLSGLTATSVYEGQPSTLTGTITDPGLTDTFSLTIDWGDGTATDIDPATSPVAANHTYADSGSYSATVTVMDDDGGQSAYPVTVIVQNVAPTAVFSNGGPYDEGSIGIVDFTAQFDPSPADSGQGFRYSYDFDNDGVFEITRSLKPSVAVAAEYLADGPGTRTVLGRIEDKDGGFTDYTTLVAVNNVPPVLSNVAVAPGYVYETSTLTGTITDPGILDTFTLRVDWGDDSPIEVTAYPAGATNISADHVYGEPGAYTVTAALSDDDGGSDTASVDVVILTGPILLRGNPAPETASPDIGVVDYRILPGLGLADESIHFQLATAHPGFLTLEVIAPEPPKSARIRLYDVDPLQNPGAPPLATSILSGGNQRVDWDAAGGETYFVEIYGSNPDFDLRIANLVHHEGNTVTVFGTEGDDEFGFSASDTRTVSANGVTYRFGEAEASLVSFDGGTGWDRVEMRDSPGNEKLEASATEAVFTNGPGDLAADFTVSVAGFEEMHVYADSDGNDTAVLHGTAGNDRFKAEPALDCAKMYGGAMYNRIRFFDRIDAYGGGGKDLARSFDSSGNDTFHGSMNLSSFAGGSFDIRMHDFHRVIAYSTAGGADTAMLVDSELKDELHGKPQKAELFDTLTGGDVYQITARAFETVYAEALNEEGVNHGGADTAKLWGTAWDDIVRAGSNQLTYSTQPAPQSELDVLYHILAFETVRVRETPGGTDRVDRTDPLAYDMIMEGVWEQI